MQSPLLSRRLFVTTLSTALLAPVGAGAQQRVQIVALGASNTAGRGRGRTNGGVDRPQAFPAQLEAMLRAAGINATVRNAGIAGDTTAGMLARVDRAVPNGTKIVILQQGGNDARRGADPAQVASDFAMLQERLRARGIDVIVLDQRLGRIAGAENRDPDGQHFNAAGHRAIAAHLLPQVQSAIR
jgi:acyl-CoA thioesterase-1